MVEKKCRKQVFIVLLLIMMGILVGFQIMNYKERMEAERKTKLISYLAESHEKAEIENTILKDFKKMKKEDCTEVIDLYLHATYALAYATPVDDETANALSAIMKEDRSFDLEELEEGEIKTFCKTLEEQNVVPRFVNGNLFFDVDYAYFYHTYGAFMNDDYAQMIKLYDEEKKKDYYNPETNEMDYEVVEERLNQIYQILTAYPEAATKKSMLEYYNFYKSIYFGAYAQDYVFENGAKVKEDLLERYKTFAAADADLGNFLKEITDLYAESGRTRTTEIFSKIKTFCGVAETEENS